MVDSFEAANDRIRVVRADKTAFDTSAPSFALLPAARHQFTMDIVFPDLLSNMFYYSDVPSAGLTYCESWSSLYAQEWGPGESDTSPTGSVDTTITRNLPRIDLGRSVPVGSNHLNIQARLRRTKNGQVFYNDSAPAVYAPFNQWINLTGGSCTCEGIGTIMKRHFNVVLIGTALYIDRYQSVYNYGGPFQVTPSANFSNRGWVTNPVGEGAAQGAYNNAPFGRGYPLAKLDQKGPDSNGTKFGPGAANSSNPCSTSANLDYESIYSVDFDIQPGRYL